MPVTITPSSTLARPYVACGDIYSRRCSVNIRVPPRFASNGTELLNSTFLGEIKPKTSPALPEKIYASSHPGPFNQIVYSSVNGFVQSAVDAYSGHHHLVFRPDDIWIAIITQLSTHVNANAEELRHLLVAHEGVKNLVIVDSNASTVDKINYRKFLDAMPKLMQQYIVDDELREWVQQEFTTTTDVDRAVTSVLLMSVMAKYFRYTVRTKCGLPSITLLGTQEDWENLLRAIEKLTFFGEETAKWQNVLRPVLQKFVKSFQEPGSDEVIQFWQKMVHRKLGSGHDYLDGWLPVFCYFDQNGKRTVQLEKEPAANGIIYGRINMTDVPTGYVSVPLNIEDATTGEKFNGIMRAGSVGLAVEASGKPGETNEITDDTVKPLVAWWIYEDPNGDSGGQGS